MNDFDAIMKKRKEAERKRRDAMMDMQDAEHSMINLLVSSNNEGCLKVNWSRVALIADRLSAMP